MSIQRIPAIGPVNANPRSAGGVRSGNIIYTTQVPRKSDGTYELGDIEAQSRQVLTNLETALTSLGSSLAHLLHLTIYLTDIQERKTFNRVYEEMIPSPFPARVALGVNELAVPGMKVEITAVAAVADEE